MNINNLRSYITHEKRDPEYADYYLQAVLTDGEPDKIAEVQGWYNEAKSRIYWNSLIDNAEKTAQSGHNLENVISLMNKAISILKADAPSGVSL